MAQNLWASLIDEASKMCGSQSALALRLGVNKAIVSLSKRGEGRLTDEHLARLGELLGRDPAELWDLQELANMPRRNPFAKGLTAGLAAFFLVNLSGCFWPENARQSSTYADAIASRTLHIVGLLRLVIQRLLTSGLPAFSR